MRRNARHLMRRNGLPSVLAAVFSVAFTLGATTAYADINLVAPSSYH